MDEPPRLVAPEHSRWLAFALPVSVGLGLFLGLALYVASAHGAARVTWLAVGVVGAVFSVSDLVRELRHGRFGIDPLALLSIVGAVWVNEYLAAAIISVMLASGRALEQWATHRARRELQALLVRVPKTAHVVRDGNLLTVPLATLVAGDLILVESGEMVPIDGTIMSASVSLDESALTGEPLPVERSLGDHVRSGVLNAGSPLEIRATATAADSTYAGIIRLVQDAETTPVPFVRLADRYSQGFLIVALLVAGVAWVLGGPTRAVAVLVVATPCPLILAVPVALVSGLSRAAQLGIIIKSGAVLEQLSHCRTLLIDKTGTITRGRPELSEVLVAPATAADDLLRLAGSLDQTSPHVLANAIVQSALSHGLELEMPTDVEEVTGHGIGGDVAGRHVKVGTASWCGVSGSAPWAHAARRRARLDGALTVFVSVDGQPAGALVFDDPVRPDVVRTLRSLRRRGITRIAMVTGDRIEVAETVCATIGVDTVLAERTPQEKLDIARDESSHEPTVMVGDGINDAPALALADVGVAMGSRAATAASEAADVILTSDRLDRLDDAMAISQRSLFIARQSMITGISLSLAAMVVAAIGWLPAVAGALLQEVIDVAVIVNSLRALRPKEKAVQLTTNELAVTAQFRAEHVALRERIEEIRRVADELGTLTPDATLAAVRAVHEMLVNEILPHEEAEEATLYPVLERVMGGREPLGAMSHAHREIAHQIRRLGQVIDDAPLHDMEGADLSELRALLYGLHVIVKLHTAQEEENYLYFDDRRLESTESRPLTGATTGWS
ncbi:MAG: cadmium-translocating P-type ATPase [Acidobacteria bacterium]|nr:cadmium-translocating P-type ATPase [Acidobacteriota bacterium]